MAVLRLTVNPIETAEEGVGTKGKAWSQSQTFYQIPFVHERGAIVQFDWLVALQSKSDIGNLTFWHMTFATRQDLNIYF